MHHGGTPGRLPMRATGSATRRSQIRSVPSMLADRNVVSDACVGSKCVGPGCDDSTRLDGATDDGGAATVVAMVGVVVIVVAGCTASGAAGVSS